MASGGFWEDKATGCWVKAGNAVLKHVSDNAIDARLLGLTPEKSATPGEMTLLPLPPRLPGSPVPQHPVVVWAGTDTARIQSTLEPLPGEWHRAASFVTRSGDTAPLGSEVIVTCLPASEDPAIMTAHSGLEIAPAPVSNITTNICREANKPPFFTEHVRISGGNSALDVTEGSFVGCST